MCEHFINLYDLMKDDEDISTFHSDVYIPLTDDSITMKKIHESSSQMKKGGYDYSVSILFLMLSCIAPTILYLLNIMFFNGFPLKLCTALLYVIPKSGSLLLPLKLCTALLYVIPKSGSLLLPLKLCTALLYVIPKSGSLLLPLKLCTALLYVIPKSGSLMLPLKLCTALLYVIPKSGSLLLPLKLCTALLYVIPKSGSLLLPKNYRRISMQQLVANLYDRIIANRLMKWVKINPEQTAFQKGKGTVDQIFLLSLIIGLIKDNKMTYTYIYIGFFDLSKAFDKVARFLLLKTLVKMGIGTVMLQFLKSLYSTTRCILKCFGKVSEVFQTYTGIKQGASSSVIVFITFMDEVIDILKEKCVDEPIINNLHCLKYG